MQHLIKNTQGYIQKISGRVYDLPPGFYCYDGDLNTRKETLEEKKILLPKTAQDLGDTIVSREYLEKRYSSLYTKTLEKLGFPNKEGILLYGKQGSGKTTSALGVGKTLIETMNARVFIVSDRHSFIMIHDFIPGLRNTIKEDFISVILWDECESAMYNYEAEIKNLLDGPKSLNNCLYICSTNYIDIVPKTIKDRKSRFSIVKDVSNVSEPKIVEKILTNLNITGETKFSSAAIQSWTEILCEEEGSTIDEIKHFFLDKVLEKMDRVEAKKATPRKKSSAKQVK